MNQVPRATVLAAHPPVEYYEMWAFQFGIDVQKYPYILMDYDPSEGKQMPYAVYSFYMNTVDGWPCASATIVYKAVHGKSSFRRLIYIMSTPLPHRNIKTHTVEREGENDAI